MKQLSLLAISFVAVLGLAGCAGPKPDNHQAAPIVNGNGQSAHTMATSDQTKVNGVNQQPGFEGESINGELGDEQVGSGSVKAMTPVNSKNVIYFGFAKYDLDSQAKAVADQAVKYLLEHPSETVLLAGNTDPRGSQEYNFHLGQKRANAVKQYFASQGVPLSKICTVSYGELKPAASPSEFNGNWQKAYQLDRRVNIEYGKTCGGDKSS